MAGSEENDDREVIFSATAGAVSVAGMGGFTTADLRLPPARSCRQSHLVLFADYIPVFQRELDRLSREPVTLKFPALLALLGHEGTEAADSACRAFAATQQWPPVSDLVRVELCLRLSCALWWLTELRAADLEEESLPTIAESVLIEYWRDVGRVDWLYARFVKDWADEHSPGSAD
jgi:hypothetical protein